MLLDSHSHQRQPTWPMARNYRSCSPVISGGHCIGYPCSNLWCHFITGKNYIDMTYFGVNKAVAPNKCSVFCRTAIEICGLQMPLACNFHHPWQLVVLSGMMRVLVQQPVEGYRLSIPQRRLQIICLNIRFHRYLNAQYLGLPSVFLERSTVFAVPTLWPFRSLETHNDLNQESAP